MSPAFPAEASAALLFIVLLAAIVAAAARRIFHSISGDNSLTRRNHP